MTFFKLRILIGQIECLTLPQVQGPYWLLRHMDLNERTTSHGNTFAADT